MLHDAAVPCCKVPQAPPTSLQESSRIAAQHAPKPWLPNPGPCGKQAEGSLPLLLSTMGQDEQEKCFQEALELSTTAAQAKA